MGTIAEVQLTIDASSNTLYLMGFGGTNSGFDGFILASFTLDTLTSTSPNYLSRTFSLDGTL